MKLTTSYRGNGDPFVRAHTLWLRSLPDGARVTKAMVTLEPVAPAGGTELTERITFGEQTGTGRWGATRRPADLSEVTFWTTADLHARHTIVEVVATREVDEGRVTVQMDIGGTWVGVAFDGAILTPNKPPLVLNLPIAPDFEEPIPLPAVTGAKLKLTAVSDDQGAVNPDGKVFLYGLTICAVPTNVSVRLGQMPPFWTRVGELVTAQTSPDFSAVLNAFLAEAITENGSYAIPFVVHSDTIARLNAELMIDYVMEQPILPSYLPEVTLSYGYSGQPDVDGDLLKVDLPRGAIIVSTGGAVQGAFDASRVVFPKEVDLCETGTTVTVSPDRSLAQPIQLAEETPVSGIDLPLAKTRPGLAGLHLALQKDADGKPSGEVLIEAGVTVEKPVPGGSAWGSAALPAEFRFEKGKCYWLVLQSVSGDAQWDAEPDAAAVPALQISTNGGFSWRTAATETGQKPLTAVYRLRNTPEQFSIPLQLQVGGHEVPLHDLDALGKVDFRLDLPQMAEAFDSVLADAIRQQAGLTERIANGDFGRWTRVERQARRVVTTPLASPAESTPASTCLVVAPDASRLYYLTGRSVQESQSYVPEIFVIANEPQPYLVDTLSWADPQLLTGRPFSLAISPDGQSLYVVGQILDSDLGQSAVWKVPVRGDAQAVVAPLPLLGTRLAVTADCRRLYVATHHGPVLFRMNAEDLTWNPDQDKLSMGGHEGTVFDLLVTPDGKRAYLVVGSGIIVVDLEAWTEIGLSWFDHKAAPELVNLELSCDGERLYAVALSSTSEAPRQPGDAFVNVGRAGFRLLVRQHLFTLDTALLDRAAVGSLAFADTILAQILLGAAPFPDILQRLNIGTMIPQRAAVTPDDSRLLVAAGLTYQLYTVDTTSDTLLDAIELPPDTYPFGLVVTPDSRRVFVNGIQVNEDMLGEEQLQIGFQLQAVELDAWTADDWALTAGRVSPVCVPEAEKPTARLGSPTRSTGLSQVFPVVGGQEYELRFRARANAPGAEAEIFWLSEDCGLVGEASVEIKQPPCGGGLQHHGLRSTAPEGADRAELRFRQPAGGYMLLDDVSFMAPVEATANSDLGATEDVPVLDPVTGEPATDPATGEPVTGKLPQGWQVEPAPVVDAAAEVHTVLEFLDESENRVRLTGPTNWPTGAARHTAVLSQVLAVRPGEPFVLEFRAFPHGQPSGEGNASFELRWTGGQAEPIAYELTPLRFDLTVLDGTVPEGATCAELAFSQPPGGSLDIVYARLSQPELVEVPVTFLSEAPGNLMVVEPVVAYDLGDEPRPRPAPAARAGPGRPLEAGEMQEPVGCRPTPPEDVPAPPSVPAEAVEGVFLAEREVTYCPCCETIHFLDEPEMMFSEGGMEGVSGTCPHCRARVVMFPTRSRLATGSHRSTRRPVRPTVRRAPAKRFRAAPQPAVPVAGATWPGVHEPTPATPPPGEAPPAEPPPAEVTAEPPLTAVEGIGKARSAQLAKIGVDSVAKLAQSTPESIAMALKGVSVEMAARFIEAAKQLGSG